MGSVQNLSPERDLGRFFDIIYSDKEGYVYSATKDPETGKFEQFFFPWPAQKEQLITHVLTASEFAEVYYGPALYKEPKAEKESVLGSNFIWCEFDGNAPDSIDGVPAPAIKIQSSTDNNQHWYWRLDYFENDLDKLEDVMQRLVYKANADFCFNVNRLLRPPYTLHHESARKTQILRMDTRPVRIEEFAELPEIPIKPLTQADLNKVPQPLEVLTKYVWEGDDFSFIMEKTIEKGKRSSALTKLGHMCIERGATNEETLSMLLWADTKWGKFVKRKDRIDKLIDLINYCRSRHPVDESNKNKPVEAELPKLKVYKYNEFMETKVTIDWVVPDLIPDRGLSVIFGPPSIGKSQASIRFAEKLAKGEPWLKWSTGAPKKTIFLSLEMPHPHLYYLLDKMAIPQGDLVNENMIIAPLGHSIKILSKIGQYQLNQVLDEYQPDGLIIDSYGAALLDDISSDKIIFAMTDYINTIVREQYGAFVWFIHHPRKSQIGNKTPNKLDDMYGNQYLSASLDTAIALTPAGAEIEVSNPKNRFAEKFKNFRIKRTPNLDFQIMETRTIDQDSPIFGGLDDNDLGMGI